jgi:flagellin-like protein
MFRDFAGKKGVSSVIGVILMVAATIVIAAVLIAMLVTYNMPSEPYSVSVMVEERNLAGKENLC